MEDLSQVLLFRLSKDVFYHYYYVVWYWLVIFRIVAEQFSFLASVKVGLLTEDELDDI